MFTICVAVDELPLPSVNVQVTVVEVFSPVIGKTASCVPTIVPSQISIEVAGVKEVTSHSALIVGSEFGFGANWS